MQPITSYGFHYSNEESQLLCLRFHDVNSSEFPKEDGTATGTSARPGTSRSLIRSVNQHFAFPIDDHDLELAPKSNTENGGFLIHAA